VRAAAQQAMLRSSAGAEAVFPDGRCPAREYRHEPPSGSRAGQVRLPLGGSWPDAIIPQSVTCRPSEKSAHESGPTRAAMDSNERETVRFAATHGAALAGRDRSNHANNTDEADRHPTLSDQPRLNEVRLIVRANNACCCSPPSYVALPVAVGIANFKFDLDVVRAARLRHFSEQRPLRASRLCPSRVLLECLVASQCRPGWPKRAPRPSARPLTAGRAHARDKTA
jgi:hypothetical protein